MKQCLFLLRGGKAEPTQQSPEEFQSDMQKWMQCMGGLNEKGIFPGAQPLEQSGRQVSGSGKVLTDGPFMEGRGMAGGYLMCKAGSYDGAVEISREYPIPEVDARVEVREINELAI